ncbi:MAG: hypothetical protein ACTSVV_03105 [Promethearchaeota archaeon]
MRDNFIKDFFYNLNNLLYNPGLIGGEEFIIDSVPIRASVNFAHAIRYLCAANDIKASFHRKDETGKNPKKKRSARKKSRVRFKI